MRHVNITGMMVLGIVASMGLAGCGTQSAVGHTSPSQKPIKPQSIMATPKGTVAAGSPMPNGSLWVLAGNSASKGLYNLSLIHHTMQGSVSVSNSASSMAESSTGLVALGLRTTSAGAVELLNGSSGAVLNTLPVGAPVYDVVAGSDGQSFYVLNGSAKSRSVTVVDSKSLKPTGSVPVPANTVSIVPTPGEHSLYALQPNGTISEVSVAGGHVQTQFTIGGSGRSLALSSGGSTLYVLKGQGSVRNVAIVSTATQRVLRVISAPKDSQQIVISPNGSSLYDVVGTATMGNVQKFHI